MTEWIIEADKDSVYYMFKQYAPLVRCKDCEFHRNGCGMCDIFHCHTNPEGYCHRGRVYGKEER